MSEEYKIDPSISYDVVPLPSGGIYYPTKKKSLKVSYLNASDENILASQNLISSLTVIDELLKRKILDRDIDVDDLVEEDRQAVLIFLRNTAWGSQYTLNLVDPKTKDPFKEVIDLSTLKTKEFTLVEDNNGDYPYFMEKSQVPITFNFLTKKQEIELDEMKKSWKGVGVVPVKTKELEILIKSVNGNNDMMGIFHFVERLPIKDSQDFRKFIDDNKPGLNLTQTVTTPSKEDIQVEIGFGVEFFRPFYGL